METSLLQTKLYIPPARPELVSRPRLIERLNAGIHRKLTLISAPTGFGKTTLLSEWINQSPAPNTQLPRFAWISLDEGDNDFAYFMTHFIAALQRIEPGLGETVRAVFQSPQLPPVEAVLTNLINEIAEIPEHLALVLDDYHVIQSSTNQAVGFLLERLPPKLHLVIVTRRDPSPPLDNQREWYRYHHLFGDVLLRRLRQAEPGQIPELHRRAGIWYESEGHTDEAIHHALAAQDLEGAARLVEQNALYGLLKKVRDLGMPLLSVNRVESDQADVKEGAV